MQIKKNENIELPPIVDKGIPLNYARYSCVRGWWFEELNKNIYRVDVTAALCGLVKTLYITDEIFLNKMGRRKIGDLTIISGGVFGYAGEVVVDNINSPKYVYGVANGEGDFDRTISKDHLKKILQKILKSESNCG